MAPTRITTLAANGASIALASTLFLTAQGVDAQVIVDDFTVNQSALIIASCPGGPVSSSVLDGLGGERDLVMTCAGTGVAVAGVNGGQLNYSDGAPGTDTYLTVQWDGMDGSPALDPIGLGGIDLTDGATQDTLRIRVETDANALTLTVDVYEDAGNASSCVIAVPANSDMDFGLGFPGVGPDCTFTTLLGSGADFSNVGAIQLHLDGGPPGLVDALVDFLRTDSGSVPVELQGFEID